jgi:hypothetical protein
MKPTLLALLGLIIIAPAAPSQAADEPSRGAFSAYIEKEHRPKLEWETLKGYRLFFHPKDSQPQRRVLTVAVPADDIVTSAWAIIRPASSEGPYADAWLRVEGEPSPEKVELSWDGMYRGQPFPDGPYRFEVHLRYKHGGEDHWDVQVLKSLDPPRFVKLAGVDVGEHPLDFRQGEFQPVGVAATVSKAQGVVDVVARVLAPTLAEPFNSTGILVQARRIEDARGKPVNEGWDCLCQQPLPADSPARLKAKKVACQWDLGTAWPGVYDLRLGLYHALKHRVAPDPCDEPVLDDDRLRVRVLP